MGVLPILAKELRLKQKLLCKLSVIFVCQVNLALWLKSFLVLYFVLRRWRDTIAGNRQGIAAAGDFEALHCQSAQKFDRGVLSLNIAHHHQLSQTPFSGSPIYVLFFVTFEIIKSSSIFNITKNNNFKYVKYAYSCF